MKHINFTWLTICLIILVLLMTGCGQAQPKIVTIGILNRVPSLDPVIEGFKARMTELGYVDGQNIKYIYDGATPNKDELASKGKKLVEADVNLILSVTTDPAIALKNLNTKIPVIFAPVMSPVEAGLVDSLAKPGRNMTGITNAGSDGRRLQWLLEMDPEIERVFVAYNDKDSAPASAYAAISEVAKDLKVELVPYTLATKDENAQAIAAIPDDVDAVFLLPDSVTIVAIGDWAKAAKEKQLPLSVPQVFPGALMSFCFDSFAMGQQAARMADQVLKGAKPGDLPVENAEAFLTIDLTTADAIGLKISDTILEQAHTLIRK